MGNVFTQGQLLNSDDISITITDENGSPFDPYEIAYSVYGNYQNKKMPNKDLYPVGQLFRQPTREDQGRYYASMTINSAFLVGSYLVQWIVKRTADSPLEILGEYEFSVIRR